MVTQSTVTAAIEDDATYDAEWNDDDVRAAIIAQVRDLDPDKVTIRRRT